MTDTTDKLLMLDEGKNLITYDDITDIIFSKSKENSNIASNNPEAINLTIAERILKQYALDKVFSPEVAQAHKTGAIHLHDLGYITRVYCSSHSIEYIKKYGLNLENLDTQSAPAKHARALTGQLNTYLASIQAYYAGALGLAALNVMYAPYLEYLSDKEIKQEAQYLIYSSSQSAFSRGGQVLFLDFNIHTGVPTYLQDVDAIGPGGTYTGKKYGDYDKYAKKFTKALLEVWHDGDMNGKIFAFPKCDFHISHETFIDDEQYELFKYACKIASDNGSIYFIFDRDAVTLSACCRLRTKVEDNYMIKHPESLRFCGFQNVTINLPQIAYRTNNIDEYKKELDHMIDICIQAHIDKKNYINDLMHEQHLPLWQVGKIALDGKPYINLNECTYIIGLIGLNETIKYLTGKELHEKNIRKGLEIISYMYMSIKEKSKQYNLKFSLEESPAESASRRLAAIDIKRFPSAENYICGNIKNPYYTNSIHFRADADVDIVTRIKQQAKFHPIIESGAIIHAFIGEDKPHPRTIMKLVETTFKTTEAAQITISPEFTICGWCNHMCRGYNNVCEWCGAHKIDGVTKVNDNWTSWSTSNLE